MIRLDTVSLPEVMPADPPELMVEPAFRVVAPRVPVPESEAPLFTVTAPAVPLITALLPELVMVNEPTVPPTESNPPVWVIVAEESVLPAPTTSAPFCRAWDPLKVLAPVAKVSVPAPL